MQVCVSKPPQGLFCLFQLARLGNLPSPACSRRSPMVCSTGTPIPTKISLSSFGSRVTGLRRSILKLTTLFDPDADALANRCTRILLEFDSKPGDSTAKGVVFAIDPGCLGIGPFPAAETEKEKLEAFNRSIAEIYNRSTFFPPSGLNLYAFRGSGAKNRLFLGMEGAAVVSPPGAATRRRSRSQR